MTSMDAASWAGIALQDKPSVLRQVATVAGRVMVVPDVDADTIAASWLYKAIEAADAADVREDLLGTIARLCPPKVLSIVKSMVAPFESSQKDLNDVYVSSLPPAKLIRVCECIMALDNLSAFLLGGSLLKLEEAQIVLNYSIHVFRNAKGVDKALCDELRRAIVSTRTLWTAIHSAAEGIQNVLDPSTQVAIKLAVVANELGTVAVTQVSPEATTDELKGIYHQLRATVKGTMFSDSLFHVTVPTPKQSCATNVTPAEDPTVAD